MKFLLDQSTDGRLAVYLRKLGHDVTRIAADYPAGLLDPKILSIAHAEGRILITDDRDLSPRNKSTGNEGSPIRSMS
jgi:predicted nuclease of predicted toxin-antitoxin system